jgi:hypothetical protein
MRYDPHNGRSVIAQLAKETVHEWMTDLARDFADEICR